MPEAAVHEDSCSVFRQQDVRLARQFLNVHPEPEPPGVQGSTDLDFGSGIPTPNS
jgi:hypothetical protein